MQFNYITSPCIDCLNRNETCHSKCQKYKRYLFLYNIEIKRIREEKKIENAVKEITYDGYESRQTNKSEPLKHGRKK